MSTKITQKSTNMFHQRARIWVWTVNRQMKAINSNSLINRPFPFFFSSLSLTPVVEAPQKKQNQMKDGNDDVEFDFCWVPHAYTCKPCSCLALRLKKEPRGSDIDYQWFIGQGILQAFPQRSQNNTSPCTVNDKQEITAICYSGEREATIYTGN